MESCVKSEKAQEVARRSDDVVMTMDPPYRPPRRDQDYVKAYDAQAGHLRPYVHYQDSTVNKST